MADVPARDKTDSADQGDAPSAILAERKEEEHVTIGNEGDPKSASSSTNATANGRGVTRILGCAKERLRKTWDFAKAPEYTNIAIALATIVIAVATVFTYTEIKSGSAQTDRIIAADGRIAGAMESAVGQAGKALNASIEAARTDQRAWFGIKEITLANPLAVGKPVNISILGLNTGKTPALELSMEEIRIGPSETARDRDLVIKGIDREVVAPNNTDLFYETATYSDESVKGIMAGVIPIYVRGSLEYQDIFGATHVTTFCAYYPANGPPTATGRFFNCKTGNSMN